MVANGFPTTVHVGPLTYRVSDDEADWKQLAQDPEDYWGYTDHGTGTILLRPKTNIHLQRTTLLHELLHACAFTGGQLYTGKRSEERWVVTTAAPLIDCLQRTPGLAKFLFGTSK